MEQIVRPFEQTGAVASREVISVRTKQQRERARLIWGNAGTLPTAVKETTGSPDGVNLKVEACDDTYKETAGRKYGVTIRVHQKNADGTDNPDNYVDWQPIQLMSFKHQAGTKILSAFSSETTAFADFDTGTDFSVAKKSDQCKASYTLNAPSSTP